MPSAASADSTGLQAHAQASAAADALEMGDIVNVQVRRYQQWQHLQFSAFMNCIIPYVKSASFCFRPDHF